MNASEKSRLFTYFVFLGHFLYFSLLFGISVVDPRYIELLDKSIQLFVAAFLLRKFFFYEKDTINEFDRKVIVYSSIFLLTNLFFTSFATYFSYIHKKIKDQWIPVITKKI